MTTKAYPLRLPDALNAAARAKSVYLGISLNALLCVALDAYLNRPGEDLDLVSSVKPPEPEPVKLSRKEKQALYEDDQRVRKRLFSKR